MFFDNMTLSESESILEHYFLNNTEAQGIITHAPLTYDDAYKLFSLVKSIPVDSIKDYEAYTLSILVLWAFAIKYNFPSIDLSRLFKQRARLLPQYYVRHYVDFLGITFEEFGLATFGHNHYSFRGICAIMDIHGHL